MEVHVGDVNKQRKSSKTEVLFVSAPVSLYNDPVTSDNKNLSVHSESLKALY